MPAQAQTQRKELDVPLLSNSWLKPIVSAIISVAPMAIAVINDPYRLRQLLSLELKRKDGSEFFKQIFYIDLTINKVFIRDGDEFKEYVISSDPYQQVNPLDFMYKVLTESQETLVFLRLPIVKSNPLVSPEIINNLIYNLLSDIRVTINRNFLIVITPSLEAYFNTKLLENIIIAEDPLADIEERKRLLESWLEKVSAIIGNVDINLLLDITSGLYPYQLRIIFKYALANDPKNLVKALLEERAKIFSKAYNVTLENPNITFEHVGGYDYAKSYIKKVLLRLKYRDILKKANVGMPKGILLFGPPGTGKTHFARAIAGELKYPLVIVDFSQFASKWYGETEQRLKSLIKAIEAMAPVIVLFDEVEQLGGQRTGDVHEVTKRVVSILNTWMADRNRKAFIIATANYPELLDEAFIRYGRFDARLPFLYPNAEARRQIIEIHLFKLRKLKADVDIPEIVSKTHLYSGAEIETIIERAIDYALEDLDSSNTKRKTLKITTDHLMRAIKTVRINYEKRKQTIQRYIQIARQFGTDEEVLRQIEREYVKPSLVTAKAEFVVD